MYFSFDPLWWRGCCPVSSEFFAFTPPSASCTVPTCTCFPRLCLPFRTWPANPVATFVLVWKSTSSKDVFQPKTGCLISFYGM